MGAEMAEDSFVGSWRVRENGEQKIIHLKPHGVIYQSSVEKSDYVGYWEVDDGTTPQREEQGNVTRRVLFPLIIPTCHTNIFLKNFSKCFKSRILYIFKILEILKGNPKSFDTVGILKIILFLRFC